jgi:hypothetical protein
MPADVSGRAAGAHQVDTACSAPPAGDKRAFGRATFPSRQFSVAPFFCRTIYTMHLTRPNAAATDA